MKNLKKKCYQYIQYRLLNILKYSCLGLTVINLVLFILSFYNHYLWFANLAGLVLNYYIYQLYLKEDLRIYNLVSKDFKEIFNIVDK